MVDKPVTWLGSSRDDARAFPKVARERVGYALQLVQRGADAPDWRPMPSVGRGVREIRVQVGRQFRVLYVTRFADAIYVLHAFEKKSQRTAQSDLDVARQRLASLRQTPRENLR
jgi:phage-related protein